MFQTKDNEVLTMFIILLVLLIFSLPQNIVAQEWTSRPDWASFFSDEGVKGTIVIADERSKSYFVYNSERAKERFIPASTFKVPHALFALDYGVVKDEFQSFTWDGVERSIKSWNSNQNLRSSMRNSVVWVYQLFANKIGEENERKYLNKIGYGNASTIGGVDRFWLDGDLKISAYEQIAFLQKLYKNELPFKIEHQRLVKDIMISEAGKDFILRSKTGWGARIKPHIGWWVGWVEWHEGPVFFATNIDMLKPENDFSKRELITRNVLKSINAIKK